MKTVWKPVLPFVAAVLLIAACARQGSPLLSDPDPYDAPLPPFSTPVTQEEIRLAHYAYSGPAIVRKLTEGNAENWNMIMDRISNGDENWITYVNYIAPGTDAGTTTDLIVSMAYGLSKNPSAVLAQGSHGFGFSLEQLCSLPFIEPTYDFVKNYGQETLEALQQVDKPYLTDARDTCIRRLRDSLGYCDEIYVKGEWVD